MLGKEDGKVRIAVLVSGGGTNLQALIDAQDKGVIKSGEIVLVVSNKEEAYALERAGKAGIKAEVVLRKDFDSQASFEERLDALLSESRIDIVVMAGFMSILSGSFTARYPETFKREVEPLLKIKDAYPKMVIARTRNPEYQYEGVKIVDVADWLLDK